MVYADLLLQSVGVALEEQLMPAGKVVPTDNADWRLDAVVTREGIISK